jgi:hypothetical protein
VSNRARGSKLAWAGRLRLGNTIRARQLVYACLPGPFAITSTDRGLPSLYYVTVTAHAFGQLSALLPCLVGWSDGADTVGSTSRMDLAELKYLASVKQLRCSIWSCWTQPLEWGPTHGSLPVQLELLDSARWWWCTTEMSFDDSSAGPSAVDIIAPASFTLESTLKSIPWTVLGRTGNLAVSTRRQHFS